jgi:hypothetical protein
MDPEEARRRKLEPRSSEELQGGLDSGAIAGRNAVTARAILAKRKRAQDSWASDREAAFSRDDRKIKREMSRTQRAALVVAIISTTSMIVFAMLKLSSAP